MNMEMVTLGHETFQSAVPVGTYLGDILYADDLWPWDPEWGPAPNPLAYGAQYWPNTPTVFANDSHFSAFLPQYLSMRNAAAALIATNYHQGNALHCYANHTVWEGQYGNGPMFSGTPMPGADLNVTSPITNIVITFYEYWPS
jgi:hypothetical protein